MIINTQMSQTEVNRLNLRVDAYNKQLEEHQKIVSKSQLEEADFLKLLITQLKNQDPTKPMEDKEFIGQMAQFTSLKQMNELAQSMKDFAQGFDFTKAVSLVGKEVDWANETGRYSSGVVDSIRVKDGITFLNVRGEQVELGMIREVRPNSGFVHRTQE
jgi:flagellar basal-body rod modification protein FlgD